jgi:type VI secretion system protein ImpH
MNPEFPRSAPPATIGGAQQLGWSSWLGGSSSQAPITGMLFEPEHYTHQLRSNATRHRLTSRLSSASSRA